MASRVHGECIAVPLRHSMARSVPGMPCLPSAMKEEYGHAGGVTETLSDDAEVF